MRAARRLRLTLFYRGQFSVLAMKKTHVAFQLSVEKLFSDRPVYFWTFTFPQILDLKTAIARWSRFSRYLQDHFTGVGGVRVFEMHPGKTDPFSGERLSHGLHIHALLNKRLSLDLVRPLASSCGFGRIHVAEVKPDSSGNRLPALFYLGKYLNKKRSGSALHRSRLWSSFGVASAQSVKVSDILIESNFSAAFKFLACHLANWKMLDFQTQRYLANRIGCGMEPYEALASLGMAPARRTKTDPF